MPLFQLRVLPPRPPCHQRLRNRSEEPPEGEEHAPVDHAAETARSRKLAERYELEFVDLTQFRINNDLFRSIPADLMLRYGFVPYRRDGQTLLIVVSDPSDLQAIDEIGLQLGMPIRVWWGRRPRSRHS